MEDQKKTVRVACTIPNGYELRLWKEGHDDGTGFRPRVQYGDPVVLTGPDASQCGACSMVAPEPVISDVDAEFMTKWMEQNEKNPFVVSGSILVIKDDPARTDGAGDERAASDDKVKSDIQAALDSDKIEFAPE